MAELMAEASFMEKDHSADMKPTSLNLKKIKIKVGELEELETKPSFGKKVQCAVTSTS